MGNKEIMGNRIKDLRTQQNLTQDELAERVGVSKTAIWKYEHGRTEDIGRSKITALALALNTNEAYLMGWHDDPSATPAITNGEAAAKHVQSYLETLAKANTKEHRDLDEISKRRYRVMLSDEIGKISDLSSEELELLSIYKKLSVRDRVKLLSFAYDLDEGSLK